MRCYCNTVTPEFWTPSLSRFFCLEGFTGCQIFPFCVSQSHIAIVLHIERRAWWGESFVMLRILMREGALIENFLFYQWKVWKCIPFNRKNMRISLIMTQNISLRQITTSALLDYSNLCRPTLLQDWWEPLLKRLELPSGLRRMGLIWAGSGWLGSFWPFTFIWRWQWRIP